jgi:hypothetical protein
VAAFDVEATLQDPVSTETAFDAPVAAIIAEGATSPSTEADFNRPVDAVAEAGAPSSVSRSRVARLGLGLPAIGLIITIMTVLDPFTVREESPLSGDSALASPAAGQAVDAIDSVGTPPLQSITETSRPPAVSGPPAVEPGPPRIVPGNYMCQVSIDYRYRPCTITANATDLLGIETTGGLMQLSGTLRKDGNDWILEADPTESSRFGCLIREEYRSRPDVREAIDSCMRQRVNARLRHANGSWVGSFPWTEIYGPYPPGADSVHRETYRHSVTIGP